MIGVRAGAKVGCRIGGAIGIGADEISHSAVVAYPVVVSVGSVSSGTGALTPGMPAGIQTGDVLLLVVNNTFTATTAATLSDAQSFVAVADINSGDFGGIRAQATGFWRRYDGAGSGPTVADNGEFNVARIIAVRGCALVGDPWDDIYESGDNDGGNTMLLSQLGIPTGNGRLAVSFVCGFTQASSEILSGWATVGDLLEDITELFNDSYALGEDVYLGAISGKAPTAFGNLSANWTGAGAYWVSAGFTVLLRPEE